MATYTTRPTCRVCGSKDVKPVFSLGAQAVSDFVDRDEIKWGNVVPIEIDRCESCMLVQARHAPPAEILYKGTYWYRSGVTQTMRDALRDVTRSIEQRADLRDGDAVLDIGSNDGTLLRSYENKKLVTVGVEPAKNLADEGRRGVGMLLNDLWSYGAMEQAGLIGPESIAPRGYKAITAIGMFYDMEDPNCFVRDVALALADDGVFVAQLMCLKQTLERMDVGNFAHEHLEFYTLKSLAHLYSTHGLQITEIEENSINGGSYRIYAKKVSASLPKDWMRVVKVALDDHQVCESIYQFPDKLEKNRLACVDFIRQEKAAGKRFWVYGASTKGNVILQYYGLDASVIDFAADRDPNKWGKFTVQSGIPITSEEQFRVAQPDYAIMLPYAFRQEMLERESEYRARGGKFLIPLPEFEVV